MVCASIPGLVPGQATTTWAHARKTIFSDLPAPVAKLPPIPCAASKSCPGKLHGIVKCRNLSPSQFLSLHARSLCNGSEVRARKTMGLSGSHKEEEEEYVEAQVLDAGMHQLR